MRIFLIFLVICCFLFCLDLKLTTLNADSSVLYASRSMNHASLLQMGIDQQKIGFVKGFWEENPSFLLVSSLRTDWVVLFASSSICIRGLIADLLPEVGFSKILVNLGPKSQVALSLSTIISPEPLVTVEPLKKAPGSDSYILAYNCGSVVWSKERVTIFYDATIITVQFGDKRNFWHLEISVTSSVESPPIPYGGIIGHSLDGSPGAPSAWRKNAVFEYNSSLFTGRVSKACFPGRTSKPVYTTTLTATISIRLNPQKRVAFVFLVCDIDTLMPYLVAHQALVRSLGSAKPIPEFIALVLGQSLSDDVEHALHHLDIQTMRVDPIEYPYMSKLSAEGRKDRKSCRYSKLMLWNMTLYDRLIYMDWDIYPIHKGTNTMSSLFEIPLSNPEEWTPGSGPVLAAAEDKFPGIMNTGVMVIQPNKRIFHALVDSVNTTHSYNRGDQGLLNAFFGGSFATISHTWNYPIWLGKTSWANGHGNQIHNASAIHLTAEVKPWTLFTRTHPKVAEMFDGPVFLLWNRAFQDFSRTMYQRNPMLATRLRLPRPLDRPSHVRHMCMSTAERFRTIGTGKGSHMDQLTLILSTFQGKRLNLYDLVRHYLRSAIVRRIIVLVNDPLVDIVQIKSLLHEFHGPKSGVIVYQPPTDSLNNRFVPISLIETPCVVHLDDDMVVSPSVLDFGLQLYRDDPNRLIGAFVRHAYKNPTSGIFEYKMRGPENRFNLVLTKLLFHDVSLMFLYSCLAPPSVHRYVDDHMNCEDIAFNIASSIFLQRAPVMISATVQDFGTDQSSEGISAKPNHISHRSECVNDMLRLFHSAYVNQSKSDFSHSLRVGFASSAPYTVTTFSKENLTKGMTQDLGKAFSYRPAKSFTYVRSS